MTLEKWIASGLLAPRNDVHFLLPTVYFLLNFFNRSVVFLQRLHRTVAVTSCRDALNGVIGTGEGRDVRNLVVDASRPWLRFGHTKMRTFLCDTHLAHS